MVAHLVVMVLQEVVEPVVIELLVTAQVHYKVQHKV